MRSGLAVIDERRMAAHALTSEALERLRRAVVAVVGLGALGGAVVEHLAMLGVGMRLVDFDSVAPENLANQRFDATDVGEPKALVRARRVRSLNPDVAVEALVARVERLGLARLADAALILSAVDGYTARVRLNEIAVRAGVPLLDLAVDGRGAAELGLVTVFDPARDGPCYLCATSRGEHVARMEREKPRKCPSFRDPGQAITLPTLTASSIGSVIAGYGAQRAIRLLAGEDAGLVGSRLLVAGGARPRLKTIRLARNAGCLHDHGVYAPLARLAEPRVSATLAAAARHLGGKVERVRFPARSFVAGVVCSCGASTPVLGAIGGAALNAARCERCGGQDLQPLAVVSTLAGAMLERASSRRWDELGLPSHELAELSTAETSGWLVVGCATEVTK